MIASRALIAALVVFLYVRSPIDFLPDRMGPLGLIDDMAIALLALRWVRRARSDTRVAAERPAAPAELDPYAVLGVSPDATPDEIAHAYREQMKRYHPDRVADLGEDLQRLAHEKSVAIQQAYERLRASR